MFVRQVKAHYVPSKFNLFGKRLENDVIPLLKKQTGFRDELSFFDKKKEEAFALSFWDTQKDAEKYEREVYPTIKNKMDEFIEGTPEVRSYEIANSTWYDIHAA